MMTAVMAVGLAAVLGFAAYALGPVGILLVGLVSSGWAASEARKIDARSYKGLMGMGPVGTFLGLLFVAAAPLNTYLKSGPPNNAGAVGELFGASIWWGIAFALFLSLRRRVVAGTAERKATAAAPTAPPRG